MLELYRAQKGSNFDLFRSHLPKWGDSADVLADGVCRRSKRDLLEHPYLQWQSRSFINSIVLDVDSDDGWFAWEDRLPPPSLIIAKKEQERLTRAHLLYHLATPVSQTEASRGKPQKFLRAVREGMTRSVGADAGYAHHLCKTPHHDQWRTLEHLALTTYSLDDLAEWVWQASIEAQRQRNARDKALRNADASGGALLGRNCGVFDLLRFQAYALRPSFTGTKTSWSRQIKELAHSLNTTAYGQNPLDPKEVDTIAKSVGEWVWERLEPDPDTFSERQRRRRAKREFPESREREQPWQREGISRRQWYAEKGNPDAAFARVMSDNPLPLYLFLELQAEQLASPVDDRQQRRRRSNLIAWHSEQASRELSDLGGCSYDPHLGSTLFL